MYVYVCRIAYRCDNIWLAACSVGRDVCMMYVCMYVCCMFFTLYPVPRHQTWFVLVLVCCIDNIMGCCRWAHNHNPR